MNKIKRNFRNKKIKKKLFKTIAVISYVLKTTKTYVTGHIYVKFTLTAILSLAKTNLFFPVHNLLIHTKRAL